MATEPGGVQPYAGLPLEVVDDRAGVSDRKRPRTAVLRRLNGEAAATQRSMRPGPSNHTGVQHGRHRMNELVGAMPYNYSGLEPAAPRQLQSGNARADDKRPANASQAPHGSVPAATLPSDGPPPAKRARGGRKGIRSIEQIIEEEEQAKAAAAAAAAAQQASRTSAAVLQSAGPASAVPGELPTYLTPLHFEVLDFEAQVSPSAKKDSQVQQCLQNVDKVAKGLWPQSETRMFGSQAAGLAMADSDIDVVILSVVGGRPDGDTKEKAMPYLRSLKKMMMGSLIDRSKDVALINARVPIIKCSIFVSRNPAEKKSHRIDISLGGDRSVKAASLLHGYVNLLPPLRPLMFVLKALLQQYKLNEVHNGGLSSYSLVSMVVAHLISEGYTIDGSVPSLDPSALDLGKLLWGFLERYGNRFDYEDQAVSVREGGFIKKRPEWREPFKPGRLAVEDPQNPGVNVSGGTFSILKVQRLFQVAVTEISKATSAAIEQARSRRGGERAPLLGAILDTQAVAPLLVPWGAYPPC